MTSPTPSQPMKAHSPTPWSVSNEEAIKIKDTRGDSLLSMYHTHLRGRRPVNEVEANAAFIVEAVNNHDSLKARIAELTTSLEDAIDTLEAMNLHANNPLYDRLCAVLQSKGAE